MKTFSMSDALQFGWNTLRDNIAFFLKLLIALALVAIVPAMIITKLAAMLGPLGLIIHFLNLVWQSILGMGVLKIMLKLYDHAPVSVSDLWSTLPLVLDYIVVKFLFGVIVTVGIILLIIPGMIWGVQFYLASYLVIDKGLSPVPALKASSAITYGAKWDLGVFASVVAAVNLLGLICAGVGLIITLPITMLASVYVYRKLLEQTTLTV
jgi:uncharacterized membrane protein